MYGSTRFIWNVINSDLLGLSLVKINNKGTSENFVSQRNLIMDKTQSNYFNYNSYLYQAQHDNMKFQAEFFSETPLTDERIVEITKLFFQFKYADFIPCDTMRVYNCIAISGTLDVVASGGYFTIDFECSSPFSSSQWYNEAFDINESQDIIIKNYGNMPMYLFIEAAIKNTGQSLIFTNKTNSGKYLKLGTDENGNTLFENEIISLDFKKNKITTSSLGVYRYNNLLDDYDFFECVVGDNVINIDNPCFLNIYYRFQYFL